MGSDTNNLREIGRGLGALLRQRRRERGLSIRALAREMGMDHSYLAKIERGEGNPRTETIRRIAACLGCTLRMTMTPKEHAFTVEVLL